jgi:dTDP-4-dehydrorhamnose 3,5-epimerase
MVNKLENFHLNCNIEGLKLTSLKKINDAKGSVLHYLKSDSPFFTKFGEAYFSKINYNIIKGWKRHENLNQNFCVPFGIVKFVIYDNRENSKTKGTLNTIILDDNENYLLLTMPFGLWYSFRGINENNSIIANIIDKLHKDALTQELQIENDIIPYKWEK